jgi:nicotinamidase-related amidase
MDHIWTDNLTQEDMDVIENSNWDDGLRESRDLGDNPAIIVVDVQRLMVGPRAPVSEACKKYKTACGNKAWNAIEEIEKLISIARTHEVPVYYFKAVGGSWESEALEIIAEIKPTEDDVVLEKTSSSGFFSTSITEHLTKENIDTLIITGGSTCGCVRATVDDAHMRGYNIIVPPECVFDRVELSHKATLLDIWMKRGNIMSRDEIGDYLSRTAKSVEAESTIQ